MKLSLHAILLVVAVFSLATPQHTLGVDPVVDIGAIPAGDLTLRLSEFGRLPAVDNSRRDDISQFGHANDGSNHVFISTIGGRIWDYDASGNRASEPFLDIPNSVAGGQFDSRDSRDGGLRSFAFHPQYDQPGTAGFRKLYTSHIERPDSGPVDYGLKPEWGVGAPAHDMVVAEWTLDPITQRIDHNSYRQVLRINSPSSAHAAHQLTFNSAAIPGDADYGNLYYAVGDGAINSFSSSTLTAPVAAQDLSSPLGSVLRINPLQNGADNYSVPADNPFTDGADAQTAPEIFSYGFRNPMTMTVDRATGQVLVADVGQNNVEEINMLRSGSNHGWGQTEGTYSFTDMTDENSLVLVPSADRVSDSIDYPVLQFDHLNNSRGATDNHNSAVVGGYVYDGVLSPRLTRTYLFGNAANEGVFYADANQLENNQIPERAFEVQLVDEFGNPIDLGDRIKSDAPNPNLIDEVNSQVQVDMLFGQDEQGEFYIVSKANDVIYQLELVPEPAACTMLIVVAAIITAWKTNRRWR